MNSFQLKIVAITTMFIDHTAIMLVDDTTLLYLIMRIIGRIALPIFCFLLTEGLIHTSNINKYLFRILILAFISEPIHDFALYAGINFDKQNILFTLFISLGSIYLLSKTNNLLLYFLNILLSILCTELLNFEYGLFGYLLILIFYWIKNLENLYILFAMMAWILFYAFVDNNPVAIFAFLAIPFIMIYNTKKGRNIKLLFYYFYPAHFIIIYFLSTVLNHFTLSLV